MNITYIRWKNHKQLNNLQLDLKNQNNSDGYKTIVLVGENGVGKTAILKSVADFFAGGSKHSLEEFRCVSNNKNYLYLNLPINIHDKKITRTSGGAMLINDVKGAFYYSEAVISFDTNKINSITNSDLDKNFYFSDKYQKGDYTKIKQLLIDISNKDNADLRMIVEKSAKLSEEEKRVFDMQSRIYRFKNAFNNFFDNLQFDRVDIKHLDIIFKKFGKEFSIDELSSGEKQIVFRGATILKDINNFENGIVLIDEPEISMHPLWQAKILQYYKDLVSINGEQKCQLIIASHSENVLKSALNSKENTLIVILKNENGFLVQDTIDHSLILPIATDAEINYFAFGVASIDFHNQLYAYYQNLTGNKSVKETDELICKADGFDDIYKFESKYGTTKYHSLPTFIRNKIDHPDVSNGKQFNDDDLKKSIKCLIELCKRMKPKI